MANLLGKRYQCAVCDATLLVTKAGELAEFDHLRRDGALAVQRIDGENAALQRQQFQQLGHRGNLVGLAVHRHLSQR